MKSLTLGVFVLAGTPGTGASAQQSVYPAKGQSPQ